MAAKSTYFALYDQKSSIFAAILKKYPSLSEVNFYIFLYSTESTFRISNLKKGYFPYFLALTRWKLFKLRLKGAQKIQNGGILGLQKNVLKMKTEI